MGSVFHFSLPLPILEGMAPTLTPLAEARLSGMRLLVVDDCEVGRLSLLDLAGNWGIVCEGADGARSALAVLREAAARNEPFHVALVDRHMPVVDGADLLRAIRVDPALQQTTVMMLASGTASDAFDGEEELAISAWLQ